jgi:ribosome-associated protein
MKIMTERNRPGDAPFRTLRENFMPTLELRGDNISVAQAVKAAGLADSGGQAKHLVREGKVRVNGEVVNQPGRKLVAGDRLTLTDGDEEWILVSDASEKHR